MMYYTILYNSVLKSDLALFCSVYFIFILEEATAELERIERDREELECKKREVTIVTNSHLHVHDHLFKF